MTFGRVIDAALVLAAFGLCGLMVAAPRSGNVSDSLPEPARPILLTFSNLPPRWVVETTADLTNWIPVMMSLDVPPQSLTFTLTNTEHAQFLRVRALP